MTAKPVELVGKQMLLDICLAQVRQLQFHNLLGVHLDPFCSTLGE